MIPIDHHEISLSVHIIIQDQTSELEDLCHIQQKLLVLKEQEKQQQIQEMQVSSIITHVY